MIVKKGKLLSHLKLGNKMVPEFVSRRRHGQTLCQC